MPTVYNICAILAIVFLTPLAIYKLADCNYQAHKKYAWFVIVPITIVLAIANTLYFYNEAPGKFELWSFLAVFIPESILIGIKSKKHFFSLVTAFFNVLLSIFFIYTVYNGFAPFVTDKLLLRFIMYVSITPVMYFYLINVYKKLHNWIEEYLNQYMGLLLLFGVTIIVEMIVYRLLLDTTELRVLRLEIFGVAIMSIYYISILGFYIFTQVQAKKNEENNEKLILENQINTILAQYKTREAKEQELKILRHDMKHILITISSLLKQKKYDDALRFISGYVNIIEKTSTKQYCKDPIIDTLLGFYNHQCKENNINFAIKINNIEDVLSIPNHEIGVLISNCLDNAINASIKIKENRSIQFLFWNNNGRLVLRIKNSFNGQIEFDKSNKPTTKKRNHGLGTKSIQTFVNKYNLILDYKVTEKEFEIIILFN